MRVAPARLRFTGRAGAVFVLIAGLASCERIDVGGGPPVVELPDEKVELAAGARIAEIKIVASGGSAFEPGEVRVAPGDVVRFESAARGPHAIVFEPDTAAAQVREFLERTGQMRSAPLLEAGATWILNFEGAPPGEYPFRCLTHDKRGRIVVAPRA